MASSFFLTQDCLSIEGHAPVTQTFIYKTDLPILNPKNVYPYQKWTV